MPTTVAGVVTGGAAGVATARSNLRLGGGDGGLARSTLPGVGQDEVLLDVEVVNRDIAGLNDRVVETGNDAILARSQRQLVAARTPRLRGADGAGLQG